MTRIQEAIASAVREVIRTHYPADYTALCHAFAVVGANLASIVLERNYRPVAGLAAIDSGTETLITMADAQAFANAEGGSYHCWIESIPLPGEADKELVDFTFGHNRLYARRNGYAWAGAPSPRYLWGPFQALTVPGDLEDLRPGFGKNRIWVQECDAGLHWMAEHLDKNVLGYIELTSSALRIFRKHITPRERKVLVGATASMHTAALPHCV